MRYSKNHADQSLANARSTMRPAHMRRSLRAGQCDAQLSLALEPGTERPAFVVKIKGDRLQDAGINHGDLVAIQKSGQGRASTVTVTRLDSRAKEWVNSRSALPAVTLWGTPLTLSCSSADIEGMFVGVLRQHRSIH